MKIPLLKSRELPLDLTNDYMKICRRLDSDRKNLFKAAWEGNEERYLQERTNTSESFAELMLTMDRILHFAMTGENVQTVRDFDVSDI